MLATDRYAYGDLVPNKPKTQNRTMRVDDPVWEGAGVFAEAIGTDRTKLANLFFEYCVGRAGVQFPQPLGPEVFAPLLADAAVRAEAEWKAETDMRKKRQLGLKCEGLKAMHAEILARITARNDPSTRTEV